MVRNLLGNIFRNRIFYTIFALNFIIFYQLIFPPSWRSSAHRTWRRTCIHYTRPAITRSESWPTQLLAMAWLVIRFSARRMTTCPMHRRPLRQQPWRQIRFWFPGSRRKIAMGSFRTTRFIPGRRVAKARLRVSFKEMAPNARRWNAYGHLIFSPGPAHMVRVDENGYPVTFESRSLAENQMYEFWVSASTSVGEGEPTSVIAQATNTRGRLHPDKYNIHTNICTHALGEPDHSSILMENLKKCIKNVFTKELSTFSECTYINEPVNVALIKNWHLFSVRAKSRTGRNILISLT